jgi:predicted amidohydrolase YtcJ
MKHQHEVPLLHDHHSHISLYAALQSCPDISRMNATMARDFLGKLPPDRLSVVTGWKSNALALSSVELARLPPLLLINFSLHGFAITEAGLPYLEAAAPELAAGRDDPQWLETNVPRIFAAYCELAGLDETRLASFMAGLEAYGIGSAEDLAVSSKTAMAVLQSSPLKNRMVCWADPAVFSRLDEEARRQCAGVKLFLDGALGARSAAIRGSWIGPGAGVLPYDTDSLEIQVQQASDWNTGLAMHAIGETAIDLALDATERVLRNGGNLPILRLEHVQFIDRPQAFRARAMGFILSMQPNFTADSVDYADRLPPEYLAVNNPFRMLLDQAGFLPGKDLVFGSDGMPHGLAYAAQWSLFPPFRGQSLSLDELVAGYGLSRGDAGTFLLEVDEQEKSVKVLDRPHRRPLR